MNEPFKIQLEINPAKIVDRVIAELQEDGTLVTPVYCREGVLKEEEDGDIQRR